MAASTPPPRDDKDDDDEEARDAFGARTRVCYGALAFDDRRESARKVPVRCRSNAKLKTMRARA